MNKYSFEHAVPQCAMICWPSAFFSPVTFIYMILPSDLLVILELFYCSAHICSISEYGSDLATLLILSWLWPNYGPWVVCDQTIDLELAVTNYWPWVGFDQAIELELAVTKLLTLSWLWPSYWPWVWLCPGDLPLCALALTFGLDVTGDIHWVWLWPGLTLSLAVTHDLLVSWIWMWPDLGLSCDLDWPWV
jgi:hypothetical protein